MSCTAYFLLCILLTADQGNIDESFEMFSFYRKSVIMLHVKQQRWTTSPTNTNNLIFNGYKYYKSVAQCLFHLS